MSFTEEHAEAIVQRYDADAGATLVHINTAGTHSKLQHSLPLYDDDKATKKAKTSGGFFNRMFAGAYTGRQAAY